MSRHEIWQKFLKNKHWWLIFIVCLVFVLIFFLLPIFSVGKVSYMSEELRAVLDKKEAEEEKEKIPKYPPLDRELYDLRLEKLANNPPQPAPTVKKVTNPDGTVTEELVPAVPRVDPWPVQTVYPKDGAILPFSRIIAYYGNLYSKKMGVLGEYPEDQMLAMLEAEVAKWESADPETPVIPALHYIAVVAQGSAGSDGKYRARMPDSEIQKVLKMAEKAGAIVFLDIQVGLSDIRDEIGHFKKYLELPNVHLAVDPEFYMRDGKKPGRYMGTMDASDINFTVDYLAQIVNEYDLPPKVLVIHRFTQKMVTNYQEIKTVPEVQFVMHMDGWGPKPNKITTYKSFIYKEPVQFTGFKLFYKNDTKTPGSVIFSPEELLDLRPRPIYIQYQ